MKFTNTVHLPGDQLSLHRHGDARIIVVLGGKIRESTFDQSRWFEDGEFYFRPPYYAHSNLVGGEGAEYVCLAVSNKASARHVLKQGWTMGVGGFTLSPGDIAELRAQPFGGDILINGTAAVERFKSESQPPELENLANILTDLEAGPTNLRDYAYALGTKDYELTRRFAHTYGLAPTKYRRQYRIQSALSLMAESEMSLTRIAYECGYWDQSHFWREVKSELGVSPKIARRQMVAR